MAAKPLTGRRVLAFVVSGFAVVIGANLALVYAAIGTFPGLEVENSYVASQYFDSDRAAQERLGWSARVRYDGSALVLALTSAAGKSVTDAKIAATVGRATTDAADRALVFSRRSGGFSAPATLARGKWELRLSATASDGTVFRQRLPIWVD